jgi:hypothetical protein
MMVDPYEFGPPLRQTSNMPMPQNVIQRIGSPFSDYQRNPQLSNVVVQRSKHTSKVILPKIPKKEKKDRSPLRTTSYCGMMEMI